MTKAKKLSRVIRTQADVAPVLAWVRQILAKTLPGGEVALWLGRPEQRRSTAQNAKMWAMLTDIASQTDWHGQRLDQDQWKDLFSAAVREQTAVPGLFSGVVMVGQRTSKFSKAEMSDLFELMYWFGSERRIQWSDPELVNRDRELIGGHPHGTPRQLPH